MVCYNFRGVRGRNRGQQSRHPDQNFPFIPHPDQSFPQYRISLAKIQEFELSISSWRVRVVEFKLMSSTLFRNNLTIKESSSTISWHLLRISLTIESFKPAKHPASHSRKMNSRIPLRNPTSRSLSPQFPNPAPQSKPNTASRKTYWGPSVAANRKQFPSHLVVDKHVRKPQVFHVDEYTWPNSLLIGNLLHNATALHWASLQYHRQTIYVERFHV